MAAPARSPDAIAAALVTILTAANLPAGINSPGKVTNRTPGAQYGGDHDNEPLPLVTVAPIQNTHGWLAARAKQDVGVLELVYLDVPPSQDQDEALADIEGRMQANYTAMVALFDAHRDLDGAVSSFADQAEVAFNPDGGFVSWQGSDWVGFKLRVSYRGCKFNV